MESPRTETEIQMEIASALWRKSLEENDYPVSSAFVPTIMRWITEEGQKAAKISCDAYDGFVNCKNKYN